ncbi:hypothetical protein ACQ4PT_042264 [Festuca glaucescens]
MHGFKETVSKAWTKNVQATDPIRRAHIKLSRAAKALKRWQRDCVGDLRTQISTAKEIIWCLDQAEEASPLSDGERTLRSQLKSSYLGLLAIQKIKLRQRSRLTWIRLGDANLKLFHARANGRRRKVHIQTLTSVSGAAITKEDKEEVLLTHFKGILGTKAARHLSLHWEGLHYPAHDFSELDAPFGDDEIKDVVFSLPYMKAPGPDGFIRAFFKSSGGMRKPHQLG